MKIEELVEQGKGISGNVKKGYGVNMLKMYCIQAENT